MFAQINKSLNRSKSREFGIKRNKHRRTNSFHITTNAYQQMSMDEMLKDKILKNRIREVARKGYFLESFEFIEEYEKLKRKTGIDHFSRVEILYSNFIEPGSPNEINIDYSLRNELEIALLKYREKMNDHLLSALEDMCDSENSNYKKLKDAADNMIRLLETTVGIVKDLLKKNVIQHNSKIFQ